jgi:hypothetical protein
MEGRPTMKAKANHRSSNARRAVFTNDLKVSNPAPDPGAADGGVDAVVSLPSGTKVAIEELIGKSKMRADEEVRRSLKVFLLKSADAIRAIVRGNLFGVDVLDDKGGRGTNKVRRSKGSKASNGGVLREGKRPRGERRHSRGVDTLDLRAKGPPGTEHGGFVQSDGITSLNREAKHFLNASELINANPRVSAADKLDKESLNGASLLLGKQKIWAT